MDYRTSVVLLLIFACIISTNQTIFLNDDGLEAFKEKVGLYTIKITDFANKIIADNKGKSDDLKTQAYYNYKAYVNNELRPFVSDADEAENKIKEADQIIADNKNKDQVAKAQEELAFYTEKMNIMENFDEALKSLETKVILELTFGGSR
jgi:hypothetical protein